MAGQPVGIRNKKAARRELGKHGGENGRAQSITERVQRALRDSEERFSATFEQAAVGIAHTTTDNRILEVNQKLCNILGYTAQELRQLKTRDLTLPEDRDTHDRLRQEVIAGERPYFQGEKRYVRKDGRTIWVNRTVTLARQAASAKPYLIQVFEDITERKRIDQRLDSAIRAHRVLAEFGRTLVHAEDETALLREMCRIVVESGGYKMAWVGLATGDPARPVHPAAHTGFGDDAPMTGAAAWGADGRYQGFMHEVIRTGGPHIARDILNDPKYARRRARAVQHGFQSSIALPLKNEGRTVGAIAIYAREPDAFDSEEIDLLTELANDISFGIAGLRTRSAREMAEERSREHERRFRETFEQAAVGISRVGLDGVVVDVNQKFCDMLGYARDELLGKAIRDITHPDDYGRGSQYRTELAHGAAKSMSSEKRFLRKDGTIMWARRTMSSVCDDAGNPQYVISVVEDITERKELERRFELTFNQAAVGMTQSGLDGRLLQVNQKYAEMLGYTREELIGMRIEELTHPEDRPETVQAMQKLRDREIERASGEKRLVRKDGRAIWVNRTSALVRDDSGEPLHYIAVIEDITERKELERRFELTFNHAAVGMTQVDLDGRFLQVNRKYAEMLGYSREELVGMSPMDVTHPDDRAEAPPLREKLLNGEVDSVSSEKRLVRKDGRVIWVTRTISLARGVSAEALYFISIVENITERKELERRYQETFDQAAVGIVHTSADGRYLRVNRKFCEMLGYSEPELLGRTAADFTYPEDRDKGRQYRQLMWEGKLDQFIEEKRYVRKDGSMVWTNRTVSLARDASGTPLYFIRVIEDITERKQAEERYRATFDSAPVGIMHTAIDTYKILHVNPKLCEMLGYTQDELLTMTSTDVVHPDHRFSDRSKYKEQMLSGASQLFASDRKFVRKDGSSLWVSRTVSLVKDASGKPLYFIRMIEDINERKCAEEAVVRERALLRTIIDTVPDHIYVKDVEGQFRLANKAWLKDRRIGDGDIAGKTVFDVFPRELAEKMVAQDAAIIKTGVPMLDREQMVILKTTDGKQGRTQWVSITKVPMRDSSGNIIGTVGINRDVSERKQAEERYRATFDNAPVGIMHTSIEADRILHANPKLSEMLGYTSDELVCMKTDEFIHPDHVGTDQPKYRERMLNGEMDTFSSERLYRRKDGSDLWVNRTVSLARDSAGSPLYFIRIIEDITERTQSARRRAMEHAVTQVLAEAATVDEAMPIILRNICQALGWTCGAHWKWNETEELLRCAATWHVDVAGVAEFVAATRESPNEAPAWRDGAPGISTGGVVRRVWFSGAPAWFADVMQHPDFRRGPAAAGAGLHSAFGFPILAGTQPLGVMEFYSREIKQPDEALLQMVRAIGSQIGQFIQRKQAEDKVAQLAQFDTVTGLPNRSLFNDRLGQMLTQARRNHWSIGVLFVDLDRFKAVNDTYGHAAGDMLLRQVAARLKECVRSGDTVGRLSGDEFAVMLSNLAKADDAGLVAQKIVDALAAPFDLDGHQTYISASIGIALFPSDGEEPDTLLKNADTAMYRAKEQGRNGYQFYLPQMNERLKQRLDRESQLRGAMKRDEYRLHYQPKVNLVTGAISGFEALLRWEHGGRLVSPAEFIPILEYTGLIVPVGEWVVRSACGQIKRWEEQGLAARPVAVNLSARQFQSKNLAEAIGAILRETGVAPGLLELELTESLLMSDASEAVETLRELKALGVRLAVDDFGTGYSSLAYLKRFPLDTLKIDRAFVRDTISDPDDAAIALAIINLAHSLKLKVVAEGVETEAQLNFLCLRGCDEMQGFYFARPLPVEECSKWLAEGRRLQLPQSAAETDLPVLLLLDDNEEELRRLEHALDAECFRIVTATSPQVAFDILALNGARIVISDHRMPEMSGVEFLTKVRKLYPDTVRVIASGDGDAPTLTRAINRAGIHKFLSKKWDADRLRSEVREAYRQRL